MCLLLSVNVSHNWLLIRSTLLAASDVGPSNKGIFSNIIFFFLDELVTTGSVTSLFIKQCICTPFLVMPYIPQYRIQSDPNGYSQ